MAGLRSLLKLIEVSGQAGDAARMISERMEKLQSVADLWDNPCQFSVPPEAVPHIDRDVQALDEDNFT